MEGDEDNPLRGVAVKHQHHYHDPLWLFTILIYFDEDRYTPTALYGWDNGREAQDLDYLARVACQSRHWRLIEELREQVVIDCTPKRMVSFIDGPLSIHCAKSELCEKPERQSRRRALRIHVSAPPKYAVHIYNAGLEDVRAALFEPTTEPLPLAWMKRDIDTIYRPHGNKPSGAAISFSSRVKLPEWRTAFCPDKIDSSWSAHKTTEVVERKAPSLKGAFRRLMDVARRV
jgi:hypothetical protein